MVGHLKQYFKNTSLQILSVNPGMAVLSPPPPCPPAHQLSVWIGLRMRTMCFASSGMFQMGPRDLNPPVRGLTQAPPRVLPQSLLPPSGYIKGPQRLENQFFYWRGLSALLLSSTKQRTQQARAPCWKLPLLLGHLLAYFRSTIALGITRHHLLQQPHLRGLPCQTPQLVVLLGHPKDLVTGVCGKTPKGDLK